MNKSFKINWDMLVVGTNGNKKILMPKEENGKYVYDEEMQLFEDMEGKQYAFNFDLRSKNVLDFYDRDGNIIKSILDYPDVLKQMDLNRNDMVSYGGIRRIENALNTLVEDEYETL